MTRSLPTAPNLEHLKKQAKDLLKAHRNQNPDCCSVLQQLNRFAKASPAEILVADVSLNEAQFALAMEYGFKSWGHLKEHVLGLSKRSGFLHIHNGDAAAGALRNSGVSGDNLVWREIYIEGPVPGDVDLDRLLEVRAKFISDNMNMGYDGILQGSKERYRQLQEASKYEEVILWFDSCMYDQTMMVHVIEQCALQAWPNTKLSLICIEKGLAELMPDEIPPLLEIRHEITPTEISLARRAWDAFRSSTPEKIFELIQTDCSAIPFLRDALVRHLQQFPSIKNGLNRSENQILEMIAAGADKLGKVFVQVSELEQRPFMGDTSMWNYIDQLATAPSPALQLSGPGRLREFLDADPEKYGSPSIKDIRRWTVSLTDIGKDALAGRQDYIELNGIDRWLGGVHLQGNRPQWRWDEDTQAIRDMT